MSGHASKKIALKLIDISQLKTILNIDVRRNTE